MTSVPVSDEEIIEKPSAEVVSDPETGEVILDFNEEITEEKAQGTAQDRQRNPQGLLHRQNHVRNFPFGPRFSPTRWIRARKP